MIKGFPSADCTHQFDYGVTLTFLNGMKSGKLGSRGRKWSVETISRINSLLSEVDIPVEFHRKFRGIEDTGLWKARCINRSVLSTFYVIFLCNNTVLVPRV
uniref:Uncharacterized protein n=1 Tax=Anopheles stephensi TaxID=30069 RepID=A0A182YRG7_ANOST